MRYYNATQPKVNFSTSEEFDQAALDNPNNSDYHPWVVTVCTDEQWAVIVAEHRSRGIVL